MNKVILIGNLTRDPELAETSNGVSVCKFSIAVARPKTADGEQVSDFFNCVAWRGIGEVIAKYFSKGNKIGVVGTIQMRNYQDKAGNNRQAVDIIVSDIEFLTPKQDKDKEQEQEPKQKPKQVPKQQVIDEDFDDSDMPF